MSQLTHPSDLSDSVLLVQPRGPGRPPYAIPREFLEELRGLGFSWTKIATMFQVSRWTVLCPVKEYGLETKLSTV
jgi:hypothetical protein